MFDIKGLKKSIILTTQYTDQLLKIYITVL